MNKKTKIKLSLSDRIFNAVNIFIMLVIMAVMLAPIIHVVCVSFSLGSEIQKGGLFLWPHGFTLEGYKKVLQDHMIVRSYINTVIYAFSHTALVIILTALTAYPLTIKDFPLRKGITIFITITMFFSGGAIPTYLLMKELHLINNPLVMVVPFVVTAYNLILFRTFFEGIDPCMRESARIDGAGEFRILIQIIMPLSKAIIAAVDLIVISTYILSAIIAAVSLFTIVGKWNDWYSALIYLNSEAYYPVQMILRKILFNSTVFAQMDPSVMQMFRNSTITPANIQMATIVVIMLPIMCIYPFIQKYFAAGVMVGGVKG